MAELEPIKQRMRRPVEKGLGFRVEGLGFRVWGLGGGGGGSLKFRVRGGGGGFRALRFRVLLGLSLELRVGVWRFKGLRDLGC